MQLLLTGAATGIPIAAIIEAAASFPEAARGAGGCWGAAAGCLFGCWMALGAGATGLGLGVCPGAALPVASCCTLQTKPKSQKLPGYSCIQS